MVVRGLAKFRPSPEKQIFFEGFCIVGSGGKSILHIHPATLQHTGAFILPSSLYELLWTLWSGHISCLEAMLSEGTIPKTPAYYSGAVWRTLSRCPKQQSVQKREKLPRLIVTKPRARKNDKLLVHFSNSPFGQFWSQSESEMWIYESHTRLLIKRDQKTSVTD